MSDGQVRAQGHLVSPTPSYDEEVPMSEEPTVRIIQPEPRSQMHWHLQDDGISILSIRSSLPVPNPWYRFWGRVLLGITWEKLDD